MTNISLGQTIDGSLSSTDLENPKRSGSLFDDYTLSGLSNWQQVKVNMESTAIDSYLQLVNASTGEVIDFNDDLPDDNLNSRLSFTKVPGVDYIIRATSGVLRPGKGDYTLNTTSLGIASSLVVTLNGQEAGTVDPLGRFVKIGNFVNPGSSSTFFDIAFSNDNKLLGIKKDPLPSQLYTINPQTGSSSVIGNFPSGVEMIALESSPNNILYGASRSKETSNSFTSSQLYAINPQTGDASSIADFPWDEGSGGDIAFDPVNNRFLFAKYSSDSSSTLFSVSLTGQSTKIGDIGFDGVVGLSFEGSTLIGFTGDNKRIIIDPETGEGTFDRDITGLSDGYTIIGAGSIPSATQTTTPTVETPPALTTTVTVTPFLVTGKVEAEFAVKSITDQNIEIAASAAPGPNFQQYDRLPYGYFPDNLSKTSRNVKIQFVPESSTKAKQTWLVIHGLNVSADDDLTYAGDFSDLGKAVAKANPDDRVLLLDWKEAAAAGELNDKEFNPLGTLALQRLGNYTAAKWIRPVAEWVVDKLKEQFGVDAEYASKNLNLIGHSLGSLLSNEIARVWQEKQTADKKGIDPNGKGIGVNTIFALDPPSQLNISGLALGQPGFGYDVDGTTAVMDFISPDSGSQQIYLPNFKEVSNFSRAFVGKNSLAGNQIFAAQADESFQMSFSDRDRDRNDTGQEHLWVVEAFKNLIIQKNELADIGKLVNPNPILTDLKGKEKAYDDRHAGILAFNTPTIETKNLKDDKDLPKPLFLTVKNKDGGNLDDIVYGTNKKDTIVLDVFDDVGINSQGSLRYNSGLGNDIIYGKAEGDLLFGGSGNDTIRGDQGNDSINGQKDNDILFGDADDDIIWGGKEDDTLIGGKGKDTLTGGLGSDIFVFSPGDGAASREEADIITDFGTGFLVGGGADKIGLAGGLNSNIVEVVSEGGFGPFGGQTVLKANGEFLAIINGKFTKSDLNFIDNFKIV